MKKAIIAVPCLCIALLASGCQSGGGSSEGKSAESSVSNEPVTLKLWEINGISDEFFNKWFNEPLQKKYPHIKVEKISKANGNTLENVLTAREQLDLVNLSSQHIPANMENKLLEDVTPLLKNYHIDLNRFDKTSIDFIRLLSDGKLYALPYTAQAAVLYYNKDIFDMFGVPYPKDGMKWSDAIDVARKVSRVSDQVQYRGLVVQDLYRLIAPLSLEFINGETNRSEINSAPFKRAFELGKSIADIPGNKPNTSDADDYLNAFVKSRNLAMAGGTNWLRVGLFSDAAKTMNWDLAQFPSYDDRPNTYMKPDLGSLGVVATSKYKDAAMKVLEVFFSDDVQLLVSRTGAITPFKDNKFKQAFAEDLAFVKGKNVAAFFKSSWAPGSKVSKYSTSATTKVANTEYNHVINGVKDINTAMRDAQDQINKLIAEQQAAQK
ncbi:MAG: transporter substrate-binding protein [Paenibacillus sp.]|jgi:multiple sugar transport system substrate-binding protein|nr:transporter substrate-binding protein [Paenibacillus sp.]